MSGFNYALHQVEELVTREFGWSGEVSPTGEFVCYCSIHGDKNASLHVGLKNGSVLIKCWSHGCEKQIYEDLTRRGAWPQQLESAAAAEKANKQYEKKYPERAQPRFKWNSIPVTHAAAIAQTKKIKETLLLKQATGPAVSFHRTMVHVYTDGTNAHSIVARYDAKGRKKRIFQYSYGWFDEHEEPNRPTDPNNPKWQIKGWHSGVKHMLYALTYVNAHDNNTVIIVEGEKAADFGNTEIRAKYPNYVFTTWKGGTQSIPYTDWSPLYGRHVIVLPDADEAGVYAGNMAAKAASEAGASSVSVVDVFKFDLPSKWDIADYPLRDTGVPKFLDLIGGAAAIKTTQVESGVTEKDGINHRTIFRWSPDGSQREDCVSWFNKRYGLLVEGGRMNAVVMENIRKNPENAVIPESVFHSATANVRIQHVENGALKPASKYWVTADCRTFDKAVIRPDTTKATFTDENGDYVVNLWQGFAAETMDQSGSCERFLKHLEFVCSGEKKPEELHRFILAFFARMVQAPHKRQGSILLFRGNQGSGKSIIGEYLRRMLGNSASITVNKLDRVTGQFNAQLAGKILCRVEEAKIPKNEHYEALKDLSTNPFFTMEAKGKSQVTRENYIHFIFTGNYEYIAPVAEAERRLVPVDVPDYYLNDREYFDPLVEEMEGEGPGALFKYLMEYKLPKRFVQIPQTNALANQKNQTKTFSSEATFLDWYAKSLKNQGLQSGVHGEAFLPWRQGEEHDRVQFWNRFEAWQKDNVPNQRHLTKRFFYRYLEEFITGTGRLGKLIDNPPNGRLKSRYSGTQLLTFPNLADAKQLFMEYVGEDDTYDVFSKEDAQTEMEHSRIDQDA